MTAVRVRDIASATEEYAFRTPIKFGGVAVERATILNVTATIESTSGQTSIGFGSMPLGNVWSFPSRTLGYDGTLAAMRSLADRVAALTAACPESGHPIDINHALEPQYLAAAAKLSRDLPEPIPPLCTLVVASPFDAAIHDAYGKLHGLNCYRTYGPDFLHHDLGHYLGSEFAGDHLSRFIRTEPKARLPLYHLVGALDPLTSADVTKPIGDGLPETLGEWIAFNGLTHLKVKLNGDDLAWDVARVVGVERAAAEVQAQRGVTAWHYSLDFNERCPNVDYLLEFLERLKAAAPAAFNRVQYVEQPTSRDLWGFGGIDIRAASKLRPVVIDEALLDLRSLQRARELGYTGAALKACKGQSQSLLMAAAAQKYGMFLCVQDLTCPGASLIHSATLSAYIPGVAAIEANARQYMPAANVTWAMKFPGLFHITDGTMDTSILTGPGLGAVACDD